MNNFSNSSQEVSAADTYTLRAKVLRDIAAAMVLKSGYEKSSVKEKILRSGNKNDSFAVRPAGDIVFSRLTNANGAMTNLYYKLADIYKLYARQKHTVDVTVALEKELAEYRLIALSIRDDGNKTGTVNNKQLSNLLMKMQNTQQEMNDLIRQLKDKPSAKYKTEVIDMADYYTNAEYEAAKNVLTHDYLQSTGHKLKKEGSRYNRSEQDSSLVVRNDGRWYWNSRNAKGVDAISLVKHTLEHDYGYDEKTALVSAVKQLAGTENQRLPISHDSSKMQAAAVKPEADNEVKTFTLPEKNSTVKRVLAYLGNTRGLDIDILKDLINRNKLYETARNHNACFVGYDKDGNARHATLRGTLSEKSFKQDTLNSDKGYTFRIEGRPESTRVLCFESPIDAISYATLNKIANGEYPPHDHLISLNGTSPVALEQFLKDNPQVNKICFCLDNDAAGLNNARRYFFEYGQRGYETQALIPNAKDFNEELCASRGLESSKAEYIKITHQRMAAPTTNYDWSVLFHKRGIEVTEPGNVKSDKNLTADTTKSANEVTMTSNAQKDAIELPEKNDSARRVAAFLSKTCGIDYGLVKALMRQEKIYETKQYNNVCFVNRDETGAARYATTQTTLSSPKKDYFKEVSGSDNSYAFQIPAVKANADAVYCFQNPIEAMAHATLYMESNRNSAHRIAINGNAESVNRFLNDNPSVTKVYACDKDVQTKLLDAGIECRTCFAEKDSFKQELATFRVEQQATIRKEMSMEM